MDAFAWTLHTCMERLWKLKHNLQTNNNFREARRTELPQNTQKSLSPLSRHLLNSVAGVSVNQVACNALREVTSGKRQANVSWTMGKSCFSLLS